MDRRLIVVIFLIVPFIHGYKIITILSDFRDNKDLEFFKTTLPWIVENIGSEISLNFHFKDSAINSGPRKCYLVQLERNIYLQAEYLRCLAHGNAQDVCVEHLPIDKFYFKRCLRLFVKFFVKNAQLQFRKNKVDTTPLIILPRRKILTDTTPQSTLKNICSLFPYFFWKPIGCIAPSPFPDQTTKPNEDTESTTTQQPNSEDDAITDEENRPNENSTQKSVTKSEEKPQPNKSSTAESVTKPEEEKQTSESSIPENVTKTEEDKQTNESSTQENVTKTEKEKQAGDNVTPEGDTKPAEQETPTPQSEIEPKEQKQANSK